MMDNFQVPDYWQIIHGVSLSNFIIQMTKLGTPIETSLIGHFDNEGRGHRRNTPLPMHQDGDYSDNPDIDVLGLYCIVEGKTECATLVESVDKKNKEAIILAPGQGLIINNRTAQHGRDDTPGENRLLLRIWLKLKITTE